MDFSNAFDFWMAMFLAICVMLILFGVAFVSVLGYLDRRAQCRRYRLPRSTRRRLARKNMKGRVI